MTTLPLSSLSTPSRKPAVTPPELRSRIPLRPRTTISRPRLLTMLADDADPSVVTLVTAPAGFGKTTLLVDWIVADERARTGSVAWLTVEESDNDVAHLRSSVVSAFEHAGSHALSNAMARVPSPTDSSGSFGARLVEALESVDRPVTLILDDAHLLHDDDALSLLGNFLRWPPRTVRTVLAGRFEPPLALQKLRLDGRVHDISQAAIAFTADEAAAMLARTGTVLAEDDLSKLMVRTEGWAAGLRLAGMTLTGTRSPSEVIDAFTGTQHTVADYLVGEVLSSLPPHVRTFLIETSVPDWFTADLAEKLTGERRCQDIIDGLLAQNFLVDRIPGPETGYRYHPLMRGYLRAEIARLGAEQIRNLERVTSSWFTDTRHPLFALQHSVHAADCTRIVDILSESGLGMVLRGDGPQVLDAVEQSPADVRRDVRTGLVSAAALLATGRIAPAVSILSALRRSGDGLGDPRAEVLRRALDLHASLYTGTVATPLDRALRVGIGQSGSPDLDAYASMVAGLAELHLGRRAAADVHLSDAVAHAQAGHLHLTALTCLATIAGSHFLASQLTDAHTAAHDALHYSRTHGLTGSPVHAVAQSVELLVGIVRLTPADAAPDDVWRAICTSPDLAIASYGRWARWALGASDEPGRSAPSERDRADLERPALPGFEALLAPMIQRRHLGQGELHRAAEFVDLTARRLGPVGEVHLLAAELHRRAGRLDAADAELTRVIDGTKRCLNPVNSIRALLAAAAVAVERKNPTRAFDSTVAALTAAQPESILLPFAEAGTTVRDVLTHNHGRFGLLEPFADLARASVPHSGAGVDRSPNAALTRRELELLRELPSWRTAEQIAADHFVSVNTIKTHLRGIYRKLEVRSRRDAIAAAHELGLL